MKKNNDDWMRALRDKVDAAQTRSEHDADAFEALRKALDSAALTSSAKATISGSSRTARTLRRVAVLMAAAVLAGVAFLLFHPTTVDKDQMDSLADNTTVIDATDTPEKRESAFAVGESLRADDALLAQQDDITATDDWKQASTLLAQATPSHKASSVAHNALEKKEQALESSSSDLIPSSPQQDMDESLASSTASSAEESRSDVQDDISDHRSTSKSTHTTSDTSTQASTLSGVLPRYTSSDNDTRVSLSVAGGGDHAGSFTPTFAVPYASTEAAVSYASPVRRVGAMPKLDGALTTYDYDACTIVHHTPLRIKALAQRDVWTPMECLGVSVGSGLLYTELTSTVYPLFINTTYVQRLRLVGIPVEADVRWMLGKRWNLFAGVGLTGEYCFSARLDAQQQPEHPFHFGAYEQVGIGMLLTDGFRLGVAVECSHSFTRTVLNTVRNDRHSVVGFNLSLSYTIH
jgi:hypothetical protein